MGETITREQYLRFLSLAPTNILEEVVGVMLMMLAEEHKLRQVEPLWRKAKRFAIRNSQMFKQVGTIAACIGAGVILGVSLDD